MAANVLAPESFGWQQGTLAERKAAISKRLAFLVEGDRFLDNPLWAHELHRLHQCRSRLDGNDVEELDTALVAGCDSATAAAYVGYNSADAIVISPHGKATALLAGTLEAWVEGERCNAQGHIPSLHRLPRHGGVSAGELQAALRSGQHTTVHVGGDRLLEMTAALYEASQNRIATVIHAFVAQSAPTPAAPHRHVPDLSQVMAVRHVGLPILTANSAQEAHDLSLVAHLLASGAKCAALVALDGGLGASTLAAVDALTREGMTSLAAEACRSLTALVPQEGTLTPEHTVAALACTFKLVSAATGRHVNFFEYHGSPQAKVVVVACGPGAEAAVAAVVLAHQQGLPIGLLLVRALRPWSNADFAEQLPATVAHVVVLATAVEETGAADGSNEALYLDVAAALRLVNFANLPKLVALRQPLSGPEGLSLAQADAVVTAALQLLPGPPSTPAGLSPARPGLRCVELWESVAHDSVALERSAALARVLNQQLHLQSANVLHVDVGAATRVVRTRACSSKSPILAAEVLAAAADVVVVLDPSLLFLGRYDTVAPLKQGGTLLLNCTWSPDELDVELPFHVRAALAQKGAQVHVLDLHALAAHAPDGSRGLPTAQEDMVLSALLSAAVLHLLDNVVAQWALAGLQAAYAPYLPPNVRGALPELLAKAVAKLTEQVRAGHSLNASERSGHAAVVGVPEMVPLALAQGLAASQAAPLDSAYRRLLDQLFGDRVVLADASGTASLFQETYRAGRDPLPQVQAVFGDNTEFTFGIYLARLHHRQELMARVTDLVQGSEELPAALRSLLDEWLAHTDDHTLCREVANRIVTLLQPLAATSPAVGEIYRLREHFLKPSKWIIGSDDWARDIGFSGLHHILASRENVNVIVPETALYTKPTPELRAAGKTKKDVGLYAMSYGTAYVASVALHTSHAQAVKALVEADAFNGPSIILAYAPRVETAEAPLMLRQQQAESKAAVEQGLWPLFRWNPEWEKLGREAFALDSQRLRKDLEAFVSREAELSLLTREEPQLDPAMADSLPQRLQQRHQELAAGASGAGRQLDIDFLVLYGSDSGNGSGLAGKLAKKAALRGVREARCMEANAITLEQLAQEKNVIFVLSTAGQGEMCGNALVFWNALKGSKVPLGQLQFAIFGLGDSHYWGKGTEDSAKYFCKAAKDLDAKLRELGGQRLHDLGLGDDQHENGYMGAWVPWEAEVLEGLGIKRVAGEQDVTGKVLHDENIKAESGYLRGHILRSLEDRSTAAMLPEDTKLTKFHGIYQQDDRDLRPKLEAAGKEKAYSFMVRVGIPGGVCTREQYLLMDSLSESHANGTLKLTTRQAFQLHGVLKWNLKDSIREINRGLMDTLAACGDVCRNVMANPNPFQSEVHAEVLDFAHRLSAHLKPQTTAYHEIWLDKKMVGGEAYQDVEPLYGASYLPRKFKVAIAVPPMNDVDVFAHCLGYVAIVENGKLVGWNVTVGGGMGMTHNNTKTYPRLADLMGFCTPEQAIKVGEAVMVVQRDHGDRSNRKHARLKYTVDDHGVAWYREQVEAYCGFKLQPARPFKFESNHDRVGWSKGVDGNFHYGMFIENGRVRDTPEYPLKTALRELAQLHTGDFRLTANQNLIVGCVTPQQRPKIEALLHKYNIDNSRYTGLRLNSIACVALPTCALAMAESERYLPELIDRIDAILARNNLEKDSIMIRMSGCPNGCSRPYMAEIALVGKAPGAYNLYLGGGFAGNRLSKIYRDSAGEEEILAILEELLTRYAKERLPNERFGDFVVRVGVVAPTLAGRLFHETDTAVNTQVKTYSGTTQVYW